MSHCHGQIHDTPSHTLELVGTQFREPHPNPSTLTHVPEWFSWADDWSEKNVPPLSPARLPVRKGQVKVSSPAFGRRQGKPAAPTAGPGYSWGPKASGGQGNLEVGLGLPGYRGTSGISASGLGFAHLPPLSRHTQLGAAHSLELAPRQGPGYCPLPSPPASFQRS